MKELIISIWLSLSNIYLYWAYWAGKDDVFSRKEILIAALIAGCSFALCRYIHLYTKENVFRWHYLLCAMIVSIIMLVTIPGVKISLSFPALEKITVSQLSPDSEVQIEWVYRSCPEKYVSDLSELLPDGDLSISQLQYSDKEWTSGDNSSKYILKTNQQGASISVKSLFSRQYYVLCFRVVGGNAIVSFPTGEDSILLTEAETFDVPYRIIINRGKYLEIPLFILQIVMWSGVILLILALLEILDHLVIIPHTVIGKIKGNTILRHDIHKLKLSFVSTFIFGILAHGYSYCNMFYSHDSTLVNFRDDILWLVSIGRWFQVVYRMITGYLNNPFWFGILSLLYLSIGCYLIVLLLGIENKIDIISICGLLATNCVITLTNATYSSSIDIFMLAFLFAVAGVYYYQKYKWGYILSVVLFTLSFGLYQAYIQTAILLFMFLIIKDLLDNTNFLEVVKKGCGYIFTLIASGVLWFCIYRKTLSVYGVQAARNRDNSVEKIFDLKESGFQGIVKLIKGLYSYFFNFWRNQPINNQKLIYWLTIILLIYILFTLIKIIIAKRVKPVNVILLILCVVLLPFGGNIVYVFSQGIDNELMNYSFFMFIIGVVSLYHTRSKIIPVKSGAGHLIVYGYCAVFIFNNIIFANQVYLKKEIEFRSTYITLNRIIDRIEQIDGYIVGETPVTLIGKLNNSSLSQKTNYFSYKGRGLESAVSVTYPDSYARYLRQVMNYPISLEKDTGILENDERVKSMPVFPDKGSCQWVDNVVVVKLSN